MPNKPIKKNSRPLRRPLSAKLRCMQINHEVNVAALHLSERVSSVQIVCTVLMPDGSTQLASRGYGDLLARIKACEIFLDNHDRMIHGH